VSLQVHYSCDRYRLSLHCLANFKKWVESTSQLSTLTLCILVTHTHTHTHKHTLHTNIQCKVHVYYMQVDLMLLRSYVCYSFVRTWCVRIMQRKNYHCKHTNQCQAKIIGNKVQKKVVEILCYLHYMCAHAESLIFTWQFIYSDNIVYRLGCKQTTYLGMWLFSIHLWGIKRHLILGFRSYRSYILLLDL